MGDQTTSHSSQLRLRTHLSNALQNHAHYTKLKPTTKTPLGSFLPGKKNRLHNIPKAGNYGVIPQERLMILDFDEHRDGHWEIEKQISFFSEILEINIRESLAVITQSGGVHIYLLLPESVRPEDILTLPKASLRNYNSSFSELMGYDVKLDADIRTSAVNAYVVGPTSSIEFQGKKTKYNGYILANESFGFKNMNFEISTISENGFKRLQDVAALKKGTPPPKNCQSIEKRTFLIEQEIEKLRPVAPEWGIESTGDELIHGRPDTIVMGRLRKKVEIGKINTFHKARAFVKAALHCCYDDYSIAVACVMLGIDQDSYREGNLSFSQMMRDLRRFKPSTRYHGFYCHKGHENALKRRIDPSESKEFVLEEFIEKKKSWIEQKRKMKPSGMVNPRVLDIGKISKTIVGDSRKRKPSQQYYDAMNIVNHYIQPLSNVGALKVLLAYDDIANSLNLSRPRISQAMRVLRERGIISVAQKQRTGMAAAYVVSETFEHKFLTKSLKLTWGKFNSNKADNRLDRSIYFDFFDGTYKTVFGDEIVEPISDFSSWHTKMTKDLPFLERQGAGSSKRYLRNEAEALKEMDELDKHFENFDEDKRKSEEPVEAKDQKSITDDLYTSKKDDNKVFSHSNTKSFVENEQQSEEKQGCINTLKDGSVLSSEKYEMWDYETVLDVFSGELKRIDEVLAERNT